MTTINQVAVNAIRLAALTQLGPLAGGLFLSGSALAANFFASSDLAKAGATVLTELTGGPAAGFFESALQGFSREHHHDLEKSLHQAAIPLSLVPTFRNRLHWNIDGNLKGGNA